MGIKSWRKSESTSNSRLRKLIIVAMSSSEICEKSIVDRSPFVFCKSWSKIFEICISEEIVLDCTVIG